MPFYQAVQCLCDPTEQAQIKHLKCSKPHPVKTSAHSYSSSKNRSCTDREGTVTAAVHLQSEFSCVLKDLEHLRPAGCKAERVATLSDMEATVIMQQQHK